MNRIQSRAKVMTFLSQRVFSSYQATGSDKKQNQEESRVINLGSVPGFPNSHDRFLIIDGKTVYHFGASLKDIGKKWFAFSKFDKDAFKLLEKLAEVVSE